MAKIKLGVKVPVKFEDESGEVIEEFHIIHREPTKKARKEMGKESEEILKVFGTGATLKKMINTMEIELEARSEEGGSNQEVVALSQKLRKEYTKLEKIEKNFEDMGGVDALMEATEKNFDISIHGIDKEALKDFVTEYSDFTDVMTIIKKDADKIKSGN